MNKNDLSLLGKNFDGQTVLITGHTGFKGSWLTAWLKQLGAKVVGIALDPPTEPSHFGAAQMADEMTDLRIDVCNQVALEEAVISAQPDFVFHLAAQPLVRRSYDNPMETWQTNVLGTLHVLEALRWISIVRLLLSLVISATTMWSGCGVIVRLTRWVVQTLTVHQKALLSWP